MDGNWASNGDRRQVSKNNYNWASIYVHSYILWMHFRMNIINVDSTFNDSVGPYRPIYKLSEKKNQLEIKIFYTFKENRQWKSLAKSRVCEHQIAHRLIATSLRRFVAQAISRMCEHTLRRSLFITQCVQNTVLLLGNHCDV